MSRILFILVLLLVGFLLVKSWQRRQELKHDNKQTTGKISKNTRMVRCLHCGLHIPENEAISQGEKHFCSLEHAQLHLTKD